MKTSDTPNKAYWAGVWFAFGLLLTLVTSAQGEATTGEMVLLFLGATALSFGSWYTCGAAIAILFLAVIEGVGVL